MKKLFFAALLATVAVGGAFATSAKFAPVWYRPGGAPVDCGGTISSCASIPVLYTSPTNQTPSTEVPQSEKANKFFNP
jgi:hypothetical protein